MTYPFTTTRGEPLPIGPTVTHEGINFAICSRFAEKVTLCLFHPGDVKPCYEIELNPVNHRTGNVWHIGIKLTSFPYFYGFKIEGQNTKQNQQSFDTSKYLLDPYAKSTSTTTIWGKDQDEISEENEVYHPLGVVASSKFDWENDQPLKLPMQDLIIYEMHVRGFTQDSSSQVKHPGTFLSIIEKIPHLLDLGINAVELMPIQEFNEQEYLKINPITKEHLFNYWGYSTVNFFAPMNRYAASKELGASITEFKTLVKELHKNGIEVILDVVFNHTSEGNEKGPIQSFKGIDNQAYYILDNQGHYMNYSGTGNTLSCNYPLLEDLIIDCLRYWVLDMHVDGFRFDLASIFYRHPSDKVDFSQIVERISKDPVLSDTKLIAEPWDAAGLYQVGHFYPTLRWSEWNGTFRDIVRRFIKGTPGQKGIFGTKLCGSEDLYGGKAPFCSINYITSHDGFTLADLVSYNQKHNLSNGEDNRDGFDYNDSWNCGVEGNTINQKILDLRERQQKNFLLALFVSNGVPMLLMGDEYGHTKRGNNNTWCQDNALNWFAWDKLEKKSMFYRFVKKLIHFRRAHPIFSRNSFLTKDDIVWHGVQPFNPNWNNDDRFLAFTLYDHEENQEFYIAFNANFKPLDIEIPPPSNQRKWHSIINTAFSTPLDFIDQSSAEPLSENHYMMLNFSAIVLKGL